MSSKASFAHHPIHPMTVTLPLGLWFTSLACDALYTVNGTPIVRELAFYLLLAGCIGAAVAAIPGIIDYLFLRDDPKEIKLLSEMPHLCRVYMAQTLSIADGLKTANQSRTYRSAARPPST